MYKKCKDIPVPDALSRMYLAEFGEKLVDDEVMVSVVDVCFSVDRQTEFRQAVKEDASLQTLRQIVLSGWPEDRQAVPDGAKPYCDCRDELTVSDELVFRGEMIVIPTTLRPNMLKIIHQAHLGIIKCKQLARDVIFWPGINKQIEDIVSKCDTCQVRRRV